MRLAKVVAFFLVAIFLWGCKKEKLSESPVISFIEQSTTEVADSGKGEDPIRFQFDFVDGYADTGPIDFPQSWQNIRFVDNRNNDVLFFDFPPIPSTVVKRDGITGTFDVIMNPINIIARDDTLAHKLTDTVIWSVFVIDEAGNQSNIIETEPIVIVK